MASEVRATPLFNTAGILDGTFIDAADVLTPFTDVVTAVNKAQQYVSVSATDTHVKHLGDAIAAGSGIALTTLNPTGNAQISVAVGTLPGLTVSNTTPSILFESTNGNNTWLSDAYNTGTLGTLFIGRHARGTKASPTATANTDELLRIEARGYYTGSFAGNRNAGIAFIAEEAFTSTAQGTGTYLFTTPVGTAAATASLWMNANGIQKNTYQDNATNTIVDVLNTYRLAISTPAAGYGVGWAQTADDNGALNNYMLRLYSSWANATHGSRTTLGKLDMYDSTGARNIFSFGANGSAATFGAFGATAVAKPTVTGSRGGNAALASFLTAMANLGWITDSSSA